MAKESKASKLPYEKPKSVSLSGVAQGACNPGSTFLAGNCRVGSNAGNNCNAGGAADINCLEGGNVANQCNAGSGVI